MSKDFKFLIFPIFYIAIFLGACSAPNGLTHADSSTDTEKNEAQNNLILKSYINELKARINKNWSPPKIKTDKSSILILSINRDGQPNYIIVKQYSDPKVDYPILPAIDKSTPFSSLPTTFQGKSATIELTFGSELKAKAVYIPESYMNELQRRICINWSPPENLTDKTLKDQSIILGINLARDGKLEDVNPVRFPESASSEADSAALKAVEDATPFIPLPPEYPEYNKNSIRILYYFNQHLFKHCASKS